MSRRTAEVDADTEDLAYFLTHLIGAVDCDIDYGHTYEVVLRMLVKLLDEGVTEEDALKFGAEIVSSKHDGDRQLH